MPSGVLRRSDPRECRKHRNPLQQFEGTKFVHIQVKTFLPGKKTCSVEQKAEKEYQGNFFWVLGGIPDPSQDAEFEFYVIPASAMSRETKAMHQRWLDTPGKDGQPHKDTTVRTTFIPPSAPTSPLHPAAAQHCRC